MKITLLFFALFLGVVLSSASATTVTSVASSNHKEHAAATFNEPVRLLGVVLKGEYLFVHDDAAMMRGEVCTFVYKGVIESPDNLVISFHCIPESRTKVASFTVRTKQVLPGFNEVEEIQFAGSTEAHVVPMLHGHTVTLTGV
jgi:hypothetical protein